MRLPLGLFVIGLAFALGPAAGYRHTQQTQRGDVADIAALRTMLEGARANLAAGSATADSARLAEEVRQRIYYLGQREYHVPLRAAQLQRWWRPVGPASITTGIGALLLVAAPAAMARRRKPARA